MRDDLLGAQAAVDWSVSQIEVLSDRINGWIQSSPYTAVTEPDGDSGYDIIKARLVGEPLPLVINAEAGAIINMIRSSLDLLAVALAERNGAIGPKDVYFPIADDVLSFIDPKGGAIEKIYRLSTADRAQIKKLKPYEGGDNILFSLHRLDILRKHQRLVGVSPSMREGTLYQFGETYEVPEILYGHALEDGTPLWRISARKKAHADMRLAVRFTETPFGARRPVINVLKAFAARASEIIRMFNEFS